MTSSRAGLGSSPPAFPRKIARVETRIVRCLLLSTVFAALPCEARPTTRTTTQAAESLRSLLPSTLDLPPAERLAALTRPLVGVRYIRSPLGEGQGSDPDPRFRLDAFDCTTFVETSLALERSRRLEDAPAQLDAIRYKNTEIDFQARRHFITSQWIPGLTALGVLEDVTATVAPALAQSFELELTPKKWRHRWVARDLDLAESRMTFGTFRVNYVPIERLTEITLPPGLVANVIRAPYRSSPDVVTHQGLILVDPKDPTKRILRHASPVHARVIDERLERLAMRYSKPRKWQILGLQLLRVRGAQ